MTKQAYTQACEQQLAGNCDFLQTPLLEARRVFVDHVSLDYRGGES